MILDKSKGFGFVEYELDDDAESAIDNMHCSELFGKVIRCNIARPTSKTGSGPGKAVWATDEFLQQEIGEDRDDDIEEDVGGVSN